MKKKRLIYFMLMAFLLIGLAFASPFFIKANAHDNLYRVYVDNSDCVIFYSLRETAYSTVLITEDNTTNTITLTYDSTNDYYIVNNNTNYILLKGYVYAIVFENGINHFIFYQLDFSPNISSSSDISIIQLFTISFNTSTIQYFDIYSIGLQFRQDMTNASPENIIGNYYYFFSNSVYYTLYKNNYSLGYNRGYSTGYSTGYDEGQLGETAVSPYLNIMTSVWSGLNTILMIEIVPHIRLWYFVALPLFFLVVWAVLRIWKHG